MALTRERNAISFPDESSQNQHQDGWPCFVGCDGRAEQRTGTKSQAETLGTGSLLVLHSSLLSFEAQDERRRLLSWVPLLIPAVCTSSRERCSRLAQGCVCKRCSPAQGRPRHIFEVGRCSSPGTEAPSVPLRRGEKEDALGKALN